MTSNINGIPVISNDDHSIIHTKQQTLSRTESRLIAFEKAIFEARSRYLVLVLTLTYRPEYIGSITLMDIQRDRDAFFNNARSNQLFHGIRSVWKLEEGRDGGGLHMHMVIFFDGTHRADILIAEQIGQYWAEVVTKGRGAYFNSNRNKQANAQGRFGDVTGRIDRGDAKKRGGLRDYLCQYMGKDEQHLSDRSNPHTRTFGTSRFPPKKR